MSCCEGARLLMTRQVYLLMTAFSRLQRYDVTLISPRNYFLVRVCKLM